MNWHKLFPWFNKDNQLDSESKYITLKLHSVESPAEAIERLEMERIRLAVKKLEYEKAEREGLGGPLI